MDRSSILGLTVGIAAIVVGNAAEGGFIASLVQPTAALVVLGGTLGATLVSVPWETFRSAWIELRNVFSPRHTADNTALVEEIAGYAARARKDGLIALEQVMPNVTHPFLREALLLAIDGLDSKTMREHLEATLDHIDEEGQKPAKVWEIAGGVAPTMGILGAVMGLIHVMQKLDDVSKVGAGIAVAFVATLYGVGLANLVFLPVASKLRMRHATAISELELMMEGALAIQEGQSPLLIRQKLEGLRPKLAETRAEKKELKSVQARPLARGR